MRAQKARAEAAEGERDEALNQLDSARYSADVLEKRVSALKAELAEAVEILTDCFDAFDLHATQYPAMVKGYTLDARNSARAFLARHQKETDT